jgi:hypothetical protein
MIKKTMTYKDYDGNQRTEDFWFNLTKAEVAKLEFGTTGGITKMIERIVQEQDAKRILEVFEDLICRSYGKKSPDGKRFVKTKEQTDEFLQTEAYSDLFIEFMNNPDEFSQFFDGVLNFDTAVVAEASAPVLTPVS